MKTKAAILFNLNEPLHIAEIEIPRLLPGQVLVKVAYSGICHSQLMEIRGKRGHDPYLPHLLGHEGSGEVVDIGKGVSKVRKGDKVILGWIKGKGMNAVGALYKQGTLTINSGCVTTFSEYTVVSENRCVLMPEGLPMDLAILLGCAIPTGAGIVLNTIRPQKGQSIAVFGLGGIGLSALIAIPSFSCHPIIAIDVEEVKLKMAQELGATHVINSLYEDPVERIYQITRGQGLDYSIEAAALVLTIEQAFNSVRRKGGLCVFASHPQYGDKIQLDPFELLCGKKIQGSDGGDFQPDQDIPRFVKYYHQGNLPLEKLVSPPYSLEEINQAFNDIENRLVTRALLKIAS